MSNFESSNTATEPRSGLAGVTGVGGAVWGALRATFQRIGESISFWSVIGAVALLSTVYYFVFAESLYDSQAILSIQNKGSSASGVGSILGSALGSSGSSTQAGQIEDYVNSMEMLRTLDKKYHLRALYRSPERNPFWRLYFADTDENHLGAIPSSDQASMLRVETINELAPTKNSSPTVRNWSAPLAEGIACRSNAASPKNRIMSPTG